MVLAQSVRAPDCGSGGRGFEPHIPPFPEKQACEACFSQKGHKRYTINSILMRSHTTPKINKSVPNKWYVEFHYDVPAQLWHKYDRKRIRFKKYENINRLTGQEKEDYAELVRSKWQYALDVLRYNPFREMLSEKLTIDITKEKIVDMLAQPRSEQEKRKNITLGEAFALFIESRKERIDNTNSISSYNGTIKWLTEYFIKDDRLKKPASEVTRLQIADAVKLAKKARKWSPTTYNKEVNFCMTVFNWMEREEYITKNPAAGKIDKLKTLKKKHRWFDKDTAAALKQELILQKKMEVYRACQFTYHLCVRSQSELMKLRVSDIDWTLKRFRFRAEVSKNNKEEYREITPEFEKVLNEMKLRKLPGSWYIFGKSGQPSPYPSGKNYLAMQFRPVRDKLGLSEDYTIYGWKHTRVVHEMMKETDPYTIQYICRHLDLKETQAYMRDFDISLKNVYLPEDLVF